MAADTAFLDELASKAPTPGGGGASAYAGALAAALSSMVGNLTVGKKTYAAVEDEVQARMTELEQLRAHLVELIDADAAAFAPLAAAYKMPKETEEQQVAKEAALQAALLDACLVPLEIMRVCAAVIDQADYLAHHGSKLAVSDAGASATLAAAAVQAASLNVFINTASMSDRARARALEQEAAVLVSEAQRAGADAMSFVMDRIRSN